jgi:hypothetical protein
MPLFGAGWTAGHVVVPHCAELSVDVVKNPEFCRSRVRPDHTFRLRLWREKLRWDGLPDDQSSKLVSCHLGKKIKVAHLLLKIFIGTVKPEALSCAPVNAQRSTDGIAVPAGLQRIVLGKDLDSFPPPASLNRDTQLQGKAANVDPAVTRWERLRQEYPEMSAPMAFLKSRLHPVLPEVEAELQEIRERILVVRVDGHPLRALGGGVDRVKADGDFAFEVAADCVGCQAQPLPGFLVLEPVVVMPSAFRVRSVGLEGVGPPIHEETEVIRHHPGGGFETKIPHSLLPEVRWTGPLLYVGGETMRVLCHMDRLVVLTNQILTALCGGDAH